MAWESQKRFCGALLWMHDPRFPPDFRRFCSEILPKSPKNRAIVSVTIAFPTLHRVQAGWSGQRCSDDVDECSSGGALGVCDSAAACYNTEGSFTCECPPGFTGDGLRRRNHVIF